MKYPIVEIFKSVQGEGIMMGTPAVFIRFAGCNIKCKRCDTDYSEREKLTLKQIIKRAAELRQDFEWLVLTGGEPFLSIDEKLLEGLANEFGRRLIQIETNGSVRPNIGGRYQKMLSFMKKNVEHITVSPKLPWDAIHPWWVYAAKEIKVVWPPLATDVYNGEALLSQCYSVALIRKIPLWIQPRNTGKKLSAKNIASALKKVQHYSAAARLGIQAHKAWNIQ